MTSRTAIVRWGGLAAVVVGVLYVLGALSSTLDLLPVDLLTRFLPSSLWDTPLRLLVLGGLAGLHARQVGARDYGRLGTIGFLLAFAGGLLALVMGPLVITKVPLEGSPPFAIMALGGAIAAAAEVGMLLLAVATLRAAVLPWPWRALPVTIFVLGTPLSTAVGLLSPVETGIMVSLYVPPLLTGIGWALLGYTLWSGADDATHPRPAPVR